MTWIFLHFKAWTAYLCDHLPERATEWHQKFRLWERFVHTCWLLTLNEPAAQDVVTESIRFFSSAESFVGKWVFLSKEEQMESSDLSERERSFTCCTLMIVKVSMRSLASSEVHLKKLFMFHVKDNKVLNLLSAWCLIFEPVLSLLLTRHLSGFKFTRGSSKGGSVKSITRIWPRRARVTIAGYWTQTSHPDAANCSPGASSEMGFLASLLCSSLHMHTSVFCSDLVCKLPL